MIGDFGRCIEFVLQWEGGLVDNPADPGGITNFGISLRAYPELGADGIRNLTRDAAEEIYRRDYWNRVWGDHLPSALALIALDGAVNSGVRQSMKWLQSALRVPADGIMGPHTSLAADGCGDVSNAARAACEARRTYLRKLPTFPTFGKGWLSRVDNLQATAIEWAANG